jgi:hypothetical protein
LHLRLLLALAQGLPVVLLLCLLLLVAHAACMSASFPSHQVYGDFASPCGPPQVPIACAESLHRYHTAAAAAPVLAPHRCCCCQSSYMRYL